MKWQTLRNTESLPVDYINCGIREVSTSYPLWRTCWEFSKVWGRRGETDIDYKDHAGLKVKNIPAMPAQETRHPGSTRRRGRKRGGGGLFRKTDPHSDPANHLHPEWTDDLLVKFERTKMRILVPVWPPDSAMEGSDMTASSQIVAVI